MRVPSPVRRGRLGATLRRVSFVLPLACLSGCFAGHAQYPGEWSLPPKAEMSPGPATVAQCPNIEGRYDDQGTLAPDTPEELCGSAHYSKYRTIGDWFCETSLAVNLAGARPHDSWVELRQPDPDTLVVVFGDPALDPVTLQRSRGDFECGAEGLTRTLRASTFSFGYDEGQENAPTKAYNAFATVTNLFLASGGVQTLERSYSPAADGSLVMGVHRHSKGLLVGLPFSNDFSTYVQWQPQPAGLEASPGTAVPSRQVARLRPFRAHVFGTVWLVGIDGEAPDVQQLLQRMLDQRAGTEFWDVVRPVEPGPHWVEFYPFSRVAPRYGALVDLQAGHSYRLSEPPPDCDIGHARQETPSDRRELVIEDRHPDGQTSLIRVMAFCGTLESRCQTDQDCAHSDCALYPGAGWGYCGLAPPP